MSTILSGIKNTLLWSYARGTWQYDILCLLIIATVFLVPSRYFGDRDRSAVSGTNQSTTVASNALPLNVRDIVYADLKGFLEKQHRTELENDPKAAVLLYLQDQLKLQVIEIEKAEVLMIGGKPAYRVRFR